MYTRETSGETKLAKQHVAVNEKLNERLKHDLSSITPLSGDILLEHIFFVNANACAIEVLINSLRFKYSCSLDSNSNTLAQGILYPLNRLTIYTDCHKDIHLNRSNTKAFINNTLHILALIWPLAHQQFM